MAKRHRPKPAGVDASARPGRPERRGPEQPFEPSPRSRIGSDPMRLAAEVAELQAELDALRARIRELEACADVDPLTHVLNRRGFERELARAIAFARRYGARAALVYLDLDGFKPVNDRHGHAAGDAVLQALAAKLVRTARASDAVGRLGGDEFAVLLWNLSDEDARLKAQSLERALAATAVDWDGQTLRVGASAGVAYLGEGDAPGDVIARADRAMYARKAERRAGIGGA